MPIRYDREKELWRVLKDRMVKPLIVVSYGSTNEFIVNQSLTKDEKKALCTNMRAFLTKVLEPEVL